VNIKSDPILSVRKLDKSFGALPVARSIDLDLRPGDRVALIGPNGAGKTSFVNLLTGVLPADAGSIHLDGQPIDALRPEERVRRGLVRTHQINTLLVEATARDNVAIAIAERDRVAWRTLRYASVWRQCLSEADMRLAEIGLGAEADRVVAALPYGRQRLLEIAIALALRPRVLLLDEPGAGVAAADLHVIHDLLDRLPSEIAILLIEHDMDIVFRFAREIVVLVQGAILARGEPAAIAANAEVRAVYLGRSVA
jgi:branched-chain amino acid transport system ATP-binding protein